MRRGLRLAFSGGLAIAVSLVLAGGSAGQSPDGADRQQEEVCTMIGCDSGVTVGIRALPKALPALRTVRICAAGRCRNVARRNVGLHRLRMPKAKSERLVRVKVAAHNRRGKRIYRDRTRVRLEKLQPNGPACEPTCFTCRVRVDRRTLKLRRLGG